MLQKTKIIFSNKSRNHQPLTTKSVLIPVENYENYISCVLANVNITLNSYCPRIQKVEH